MSNLGQRDPGGDLGDLRSLEPSGGMPHADQLAGSGFKSQKSCLALSIQGPVELQSSL